MFSKIKIFSILLFFVFALQVFAVSAFAVTAAPTVHNTTQPNGYKFCAILIGDEHASSVHLADCNLSFDENLGRAEIYEGSDGYWRFKNNDTIIGIRDNGNNANGSQDLKTLIIIAVILITVVLIAFKFRNKLFKKK